MQSIGVRARSQWHGTQPGPADIAAWLGWRGGGLGRAGRDLLTATVTATAPANPCHGHTAASSHAWADALGYQLQGPPSLPTHGRLGQVEHGIPEEHWTDASAIIDPDSNGPRIYFQRVPEPKAVKNRLHLDVNAGGPPGTPPPDRRARVDKTVERLAASGATFVTARTDYGEYCVTMLDPEGNEFDVQ